MCLALNRIAVLIRIFSGNTLRYVVVLSVAKFYTKSIRRISRYILASFVIEHFDVTSRRPYWCTKKIFWKLNSFLM